MICQSFKGRKKNAIPRMPYTASNMAPSSQLDSPSRETRCERIAEEQRGEDQHRCYKESNLQAGAESNGEAEVHLILPGCLNRDQVLGHIADDRHDDSAIALFVAPDMHGQGFSNGYRNAIFRGATLQGINDKEHIENQHGSRGGQARPRARPHACSGEARAGA